MKRIFTGLLFSIFLCQGLSARADWQTPRPEKEATLPAERPLWSLGECMRYAVENSPKTKKQSYLNNTYKQNHMEAIADLLPGMSASASSSWGFGRSIDPGTNTYGNTANFNNYYSVSASMPIFNGFALVNNVRASRIARLRGVEETQKVVDDIALATMQAYFDLIYYMGAVEMAREQLDESRKNLYKTQKMEELGLMGRADIFQIEAQVASDDYNLTNQENLCRTALLALKDNMNYPLADTLVVDPVVGTQGELIAQSASDIFEEAQLRLPQAKIASLAMRESELGYAMAKGRLYPYISVSGGYSTNFFKNLTSGKGAEGFKSQLNNNGGESVGISLSIPLFNGLTRRSNVNRSRNTMRVAQQENVEALRLLQSEIEQAVMDVEGLAKQFTQSIKKVIATEEAHRANQRKFDQGLISALELQTSANQLLLAKAQRLQIRLQYLLKSRLVEFYKGVPLVETAARAEVGPAVDFSTVL